MGNAYAEHRFLDLGRAEAPDPYAIQPGAILLGRFCVIARVRHATESWRVLVTDIQRVLGAPPNHRLDLHFVPADDRLEGVIRLALPPHQRGTRRADALVLVDGGLCLLTAPADGPTIDLPLPEEEALSMARTLAGIVAGVHHAGIAGIRFDLRELRLDAFGRPQLATWRHLTALRMAGADDDALEADARELVEMLCALGSDQVARLLREVPLRSEAVLERLTQLQPDRKLPTAADVLPAIPPFVGRDLALLRLHDAVARARHDGPELFHISGPHGSGRSRLLAQLAADFERGDGLFTVYMRFSRSQPTNGLGPLMERVVDRLDLLPTRDREQCIARIATSVGPLGGVLQSIGSRIAAMFGPAPPLPDIPLDEKFIRHAATLAALLSAIGTQNHPLVLLLDDLQEADASIRAVLYHLLTPGRSHNTAIIVTGPTELELPGNVIHVRLQPLGEAAFTSMVQAALPGQVESPEKIARVLLDGSDGGPGTAWAMLRAWVEEGAIRQDRQGRWVLEHEPTLAHLPLRNVWEGLSPDARTVGTLVVARAQPIPADWIHQVTRWAPGRANAALEPLLTGSVLVAHPDGMMFWPDDHTADGFGANVSDGELAAAHRIISQWLEAPDSMASIELRAFHQEKGAQEGTKDEKLAVLHMDAGRLHLERCDAERSEWHFSRAAARTTNLGRTRLALEGRADALLLVDRCDEALVAYLASMDGDDDSLRALDLANKAVYSFHLRGKPDACAVVADRALRRVGEAFPSGWFHAARLALPHAIAWLGGRPHPSPGVADRLCQLTSHLMVGIGTAKPFVGFYCLFLGQAAAVGRRTVDAARMRAFLAAIVASMGMPRRMRRLTDRAQEDLTRAGDHPACEGFVLHMRGQSELALGNYSVGSDALTRAVSSFRRAGDLSMGVFSLTLSVIYGLDREATPALLKRLTELDMVAWRQRNDAVLPTVRSARLWVAVRSGQISDPAAVRDAVSQILGGAIKDSYSEITSHTYAALALIHVGEANLAVPLATRARQLLEATVPRPPFLDVALVAECLALVSHLGSGDLERGRRALARLTRRCRAVPALRTVTQLMAARLAIKEGRTEVAKRELAAVVESLPRHGQAWHVYEAHQLLAELSAGTDAPAARAHLDLAHDLRQRLHITGATTDERSPTASSAPVTDARTTVRGIWNTIKATVPAGVQLADLTMPQCVLDGDAETLELLAVNLILAARDATSSDRGIEVSFDQAHLTAEQVQRFPAGKAGSWVALQITATGTLSSTSRGALYECQSICGQVGGFLEISETAENMCLTALLPAVTATAPPAEEVAVVVHRDPRVRRGLVDSMRREGWTVIDLPPGEAWPMDTTVALVEHGLPQFVPTTGAAIVYILPRGAPVPEGQPVLRIPYLVRELDDVLSRLDRSPNGSASRPV